MPENEQSWRDNPIVKWLANDGPIAAILAYVLYEMVGRLDRIYEMLAKVLAAVS